jgi:group I intron endonuclease
MIIYKITNNISHKIYVGQTTKNLQKRINDHIKGGSHLSNSIRKYGIENFTIEEICMAENRDELNRKEQFWIEKLNSKEPNGYNLTSGGLGILNPVDTTRQKMSDWQLGKPKKINALIEPKLCECGCLKYAKPGNRFIQGHNAKQTGFQQGSSNCSFKDGATKKQKEWKESVYLRDKYSCQKCFNEKGFTLNAHHIKPKEKFPELMFDVNNGITLCNSCHRAEHEGAMLNKHHTETSKQKMRKPKPEGFGEIISIALTGRNLTEEHKINIGLGSEGRTGYWTGKTMPKITTDKMSVSAKKGWEKRRMKQQQ